MSPMTNREQRYAVMGIIQEMIGKPDDGRIVVVLETEDGLLIQCRVGMLTEQEFTDLLVMVGGMNLESKETYSEGQKRGTFVLRRVDKDNRRVPSRKVQGYDQPRAAGGGRPKGSKNTRKPSGNTKRFKRGDTPPED